MLNHLLMFWELASATVSGGCEKRPANLVVRTLMYQIILLNKLQLNQGRLHTAHRHECHAWTALQTTAQVHEWRHTTNKQPKRFYQVP